MPISRKPVKPSSMFSRLSLIASELNAEIIKYGYGNAYTRFPFKYLDEFRRYEREAREHRRGLYRLPANWH